MSNVSLVINGVNVEVERDTTVLDAARSIGVKIPTLCHVNLDNKGTKNNCASCRVCMVESGRGLIPSCATLVKDKMNIKTHSAKAINARKTIVELMLSDHPQDCLTCDKNNNCELQKIAAELGIREIRYQGQKTCLPKDVSSKSIVKDFDKCILCRRCEKVCNEIQSVGVLSGVNRGFETVVGTFFDTDLADSDCTFCGQCIAVCPTAALTEVNNIPKVWNLLDKYNDSTVVQVAPAVRVAIGEEFGLEPGSISTGKLASALRALGFKYVFDTNFSADLTIMEEATEFIDRFTKNENLPMFTSCCPGWINFIEKHYEEYLHLPSTCKSPQEMFGAIAKHYFAPKINLTPNDLKVVSIMPCVAKKYEASREELGLDGVSDVDVVITTRELAKMIREAGIDFNKLPDSNFDSPLGLSTGASDIFGTTGGVLEAALRTAYEFITKTPLDALDFTALRGLEGIKEASVNINGTEVKVAVASSLGNARKLLEEIKAGNCEYHLIEVMACPGGCINGGGQPYHNGDYDIINKRSQGLYNIDANKPLRKSHENPDIQILYSEYLGNPGGHIAHELLHTHYIDRSNLFTSNDECEKELATNN